MTPHRRTAARSLTPPVLTLLALWALSFAAMYLLARQAVPQAARLGSGHATLLPLLPEAWLGMTARVLAHAIAGMGFAHVAMGTRCPAWFPPAVVAGMSAIVWGVSAACALGDAGWALGWSGLMHLPSVSPLESPAALASIAGALLGTLPHQFGLQRTGS